MVESTIEPAPVVSLKGNVASGAVSRKVTVRSRASIDSMVSRRDDGPTSESIFLTRSNENRTSLAVILRPLEKVMSSRSRHR